MRFLLASIMLMFSAGAANAALTFHFEDPFGANAVDGQEQTITFNGISNNPDPVVIDGLTSEVTLTLVSVSDDGTTWTFDGSLLNTSSAPVTDSRVTGFGFDVDPDLLATASSVSGGFTVFIDDGGFPNPVGDLEGCVTPGGGSCQGGGGGGALFGGPALDFTMILVLEAGSEELWLDNLAVRYQAIAGGCIGEGCASGVGVATMTMIPEPATWMMMILGFGMIGLQLRRREHANVSLS